MNAQPFCSVCLSSLPCEGDIVRKLWGGCARAGCVTDRAGPLPPGEQQSARIALWAARQGAASVQAA